MTPGDNYGIQNKDSVVAAPQAAGPFASAQQQVNGAADASAAAAVLAEAVETVREDLARLRVREPATVSADAAAEAEGGLQELAVMAKQPDTANRRALTRHVHTVSTAIGSASALATALATLEEAVRKLIGLS